MVLVLDDHPIARQGLESIIKLHKPEEETFPAAEAAAFEEKTD